MNFSIARIIPALFPAAVVTLFLVLLMHLLIEGNMTETEDYMDINIPDILMPDRHITTEYDTAKPDKPEEVDEPPPQIPDPVFEAPEAEGEITYRPNVQTKVQVGGLGGFISDGEYLPIVKVTAKYPSRALSRSIEGYCTVEYTVTSTGETRDVTVVDCPQQMFASVSVKAAEKFKYKPKVIDGVAVDVPGVRNRFTFEMSKDQN